MEIYNYSIDVIENGMVTPIAIPDIGLNKSEIRSLIINQLETVKSGMLSPELARIVRKQNTAWGVSFWTEEHKGLAIHGYTGYLSQKVIIANKIKELNIYREMGWPAETEFIYSIEAQGPVEVIKDRP